MENETMEKVSESTQITSLEPVVIEELDENSVSSINVPMSEFMEARALKVDDVNNTPTVYEDIGYVPTNDVTELENVDISSIDIEEDRLTKQFLNGQISFSEYSLTLENDADFETDDTEVSRSIIENESTADSSTSERKRPFYLRAKHSSLRKKRRTLPPHLQGLMGEANLRCAKGETELASQMCLEIIRQVPSAPEPFQTLAMIYENDQPEKSLQFALIAAHLSPRDADQWVRLAYLSLENGNLKQAITCYSKAILANPKDATLYEARGRLQEQMGDKKASLRGFLKLINQLGPEDAEMILKYAKMLAQRYMQENNYEHALNAMENLFNKCPDRVTLGEVNVMIELLIALKQFRRCLDLLTQYTSIWIRYKGETEESNASVGINIKKEMHIPRTSGHTIEACDIPDNVAVDLKAKCLIVLIELNELEIAEEFLPKLYEIENPEISGDLFLDVAEALMAKKQFRRALVLLEPLVNSVNYSLAAVWLRHAECWVGCGNIEQALRSYEVVRELSPQHLGARIELARLYDERGQLEEAIEVLTQNPDVDAFDPDVLYNKTLLLYKAEKYDKYFTSGMLLFSRHCLILRTKSEMLPLSNNAGLRQRLEALRVHRQSLGESLEDDNMPVFMGTDAPPLEKEFKLFLQMCETACKLKRLGLLQKLCFSALTSKKFDPKSAHLIFLCLVSCIHINDTFHGFNVVREMVKSNPKTNYWNLLNIIIQRAEDSRHNRFIMRLLGREDVFSHLHILHANNCLVSGTYKYALNDYISLFKVEPTSLLALLIAVTHLQMACQKFAARKNQIVVQAIAFMQKYAQLRGKTGEQEINYNMGRAFHQLGLLPTAVHYYKLVLTSSAPKLIQEHTNLLDLKKEAAFNLHLIYLQSENYHLARMYLENYVVV